LNLAFDSQNINFASSLIPQLNIDDFNVNCPSCGQFESKRLGALPQAYHFCALNFDQVVNQGDLMQCSTCGLVFRSPCIPQVDLDALYTMQPSSFWAHDESSVTGRQDFQAILGCLDQTGRKVTSILDVGCFTGSLLLLLKQRYNFAREARLVGIEPAFKAAETARAAGIEVIAASVIDFNTGSRKFDLIVMTDVFEHLLSSTKVLAELARALNPQGHLMIVTGAFDRRPFSFWGHRYCYAAMPEDLVFITKRHAEWCDGRWGSRWPTIASSTTVFRSLSDRLKAWAKRACYLLTSLMQAAFFDAGEQKLLKKLRTIRGYGMQNILFQPDHALILMEVLATDTR
jgi:SAM-dependent methyltransferase